jgi:hypothetical protein
VNYKLVEEMFIPDGLTLIQTGTEPRDPSVVSGALAELTGLDVADVAQRVRRHKGPIVIGPLHPELANALLPRVGVACQAVAQVPAVLRHGVAHWIDYDDAHLRIGHGTEVEAIAWPSVLLISATWVEHVDKQDANHQQVADVFWTAEAGILGARLLARHLPFAFLGKRLRPTNQDNFRLVLSDLSDHATQAKRSEACARLVAGEPLPPGSGFTSPELFDCANLQLLGLPW